MRPMTTDDVRGIALAAISEHALPWMFMGAENVMQTEWRITFSNQGGELKVAHFVAVSNTALSIRKGILAAFGIIVA